MTKRILKDDDGTVFGTQQGRDVQITNDEVFKRRLKRLSDQKAAAWAGSPVKSFLDGIVKRK